MELRSCRLTHFIQTIRGGMVTKVHNLNPHRRPVPTKILKDVYEAEDAKKLARPPSILDIDYKLVKSENPCFPMADRTLQETKPKMDESASCSEDDGDSGLDEDITLRQLKKRFVKKRKHILTGDYSKNDTANGKLVEDDSDLNEPLVNFKRKKSKFSKSERKQNSSTSIFDITVKSEEDLVHEDSHQADSGLSPVIHVKIEVLDAEQSECQNKASSDDASPFCDNVLIPGEVESKEFQKIAQLECSEPLLCAVKYPDCLTNEISYEHLEDVEPILMDVEPISMLVPWDANVKLETLELCCEEESIDAHSCTWSLAEGPNSDIYPRNSSHVEDAKLRIGFDALVPDMATNNSDGFMEFQEYVGVSFENKTEPDCPHELDDSLCSPVENYHSNLHSVILLKAKENLISREDIVEDEKKSSTCSSDSIKTNALNCEVAPKEYQKIVQDEYREPLLCAGKYQDRATNEISYEHLKDVEPILEKVEPILVDAEPVSMLVPRDASVKFETLELCCEETLDMPLLAIEKQEEIRRSFSEDPNSDICRDSRSSHEILVPDMATNDIDGFVELGIHQECIGASEKKTEADCPHELDETLSSPVENCLSISLSLILLKTKENLISREDTIADKEQPSACFSDSTESNGSNCEGHIENVLLKAEGKHNSPIIDAKRQSSPKNRILELHQPPERLLSARKVISPSSQERLCLAMNAVGIVNAKKNIVSEYKGERSEKHIQKKASSLRADFRSDKITVDRKRPLQVQNKVVTSPKRVIKKSRISKANDEGPRFSRTLPNLSTEYATIQSCSESAIVFSQRQMQDMESVSVKLMNELKSMKDIVEQKLLFQAYRNGSLKNDADEVKLAIDSAKKVEDVAKKWVSVMARDCNRFCKIMKMTPNSSASSCDTVPRKGRKVIFADEAGGKLCHVKYYENGANSPLSDGEK